MWGGTCYLCGNDFPQGELQVDHRKGNHRFRSMDNLQSYMEALLFITEDDLSFVCKPCHKLKSMAERSGMTMDEARKRKEVIEFSKKSLTQQLSELKSLRVVPEKSTKKASVEAYENYINTQRG